MSAKFEVGQAVCVSDRGRTYAGEIVKVSHIVVEVRYLGRVVEFWHSTQRALGTETGPPICFSIQGDVDSQDRMQAARQVLASYGIELSPRHTFTVEQVEALAEVARAWQK